MWCMSRSMVYQPLASLSWLDRPRREGELHGTVGGICVRASSPWAGDGLSCTTYRFVPPRFQLLPEQPTFTKTLYWKVDGGLRTALDATDLAMSLRVLYVRRRKVMQPGSLMLIRKPIITMDSTASYARGGDSMSHVCGESF